MPTISGRELRRHSIATADQRTPFERDRVRILYCSAFKRLAGITQIARVGDVDVFHNRLTHSLKVAQLGRRIAQRRSEQQSALCQKLGVDAEVVEAACLAHDLGHPPFGHSGEHVLNDLVIQNGDSDGYDGNAQSFRILTKLAVRFRECGGLDLTRATLAASIKYPWHRDENDPSKSKKWGVYRTERDDFEFAFSSSSVVAKVAEADIMDWADDIAYSVHDLEDFHRCNAIPWGKIFSKDGREQLVEGAKKNWWKAPVDAAGRLRDALEDIEKFFKLYRTITDGPYEGNRQQRVEIRMLTSQLIGRYLHALEIVEPTKPEDSCVSIDADLVCEVRILKQITRDYVISSPALMAQQKGHERVIRALYQDVLDEVTKPRCKYLPRRFLHFLDDKEATKARIAADCVASLTEAEAVALHGRLSGHASGSVLDPIVR